MSYVSDNYQGGNEMYSLLKGLDSYINLDGLMAMSSIIVGLLIPVAILLIENNGNSNDLSFKWDKMVIFSQVIKIRTILWGLGLITLPLVLAKNIQILPLVIFFYIIGFVVMFSLLKNAYYWIISKEDGSGAYRNTKRYDFLNNLSGDIVNQIIVWNTIWGDRKQRIGLEESKLLPIFFKHYKEAENSKKFELLNTYLRDFDENTCFVVTSQNYDTIQKYIFTELSELLKKSSNYDVDKYNLITVFKRLFIEFTRQCYVESDFFICKYLKNFNEFFEKEDSKSLTRLFTKDITRKFIKIIEKESPNFEIKLEDSLPKCLRYFDQTDSEKQGMIILMFRDYIENYLQNTKQTGHKKLTFLNDLFSLVFAQISLSTFFTFEDFNNYYMENLVSQNQFSDESIMISFFENYANSPWKIMATVENNFKDVTWTNNLIRLAYSGHPLVSSAILKQLSDTISLTIESSELEEISNNKLTNLKEKIDELIKTIDKVTD